MTAVSGAIAYSLFTDYELGPGPNDPDGRPAAAGCGLWRSALRIASIFGFPDLVHLPHLILGLVEIGATLTTRATPDERRVVEVGRTRA